MTQPEPTPTPTPTVAGREPRGLRVSTLAPRGALPGCPGRIVLTIDKNDCGSWSTPCSLDLSLDCEAPGCWWSRSEWDGEVDAELFGVAASMHALDAAEDDSAQAGVTSEPAQSVRCD